VAVGRKNGDPKPHIVLGGIGIQANHGYFETRDNGDVYLVPRSKEAMDQISVNGEKLKDMKGMKLRANDRVIFGTNSVFLFKHPEKESEASQEDSEDNPIIWEDAQKEKSEHEDKEGKAAQEEMKKKQEAEAKEQMAELEAKMEEERKQ